MCPFPTDCVNNVNGCVSGSTCKNVRSSPHCLRESSSILTACMSCLPLPCSATARLQLQTLSTADMHVLNGAFGPDLVKEWSSWIFGHCASNASFLSFFVFCRVCRRYLFLPPNSCTSLLEESARVRVTIVLSWSTPLVLSWARHLFLVHLVHPVIQELVLVTLKSRSGATMLSWYQVVIRSTLKGKKYSPQIAISPSRYTTGCPVRG